MNAEEWRRIREVLEPALELEQAERRSFVAAACADQPALRLHVESFLEAYEEDAALLETSILEQLKVGVGLESKHLIGQCFGPYRLVRRLGEGGMSTVYLADRVDGQYRQQAAVKVLHTSSVELSARRFRIECQVLARLAHPNIARLFDVGAREDGLLYLVMEYIEGMPIDLYCDTHRLSISDRLKLFLEVCDAVHCAHQNLVVHCDLKPSNILVTAEGVPKLLDFGIAKLLAPALYHQFFDPTLTALRPMTPRYASPEQVNNGFVTTASDVYSLGVLLYELLTGRYPYRLKSDLPHELMRAAVEEEPERPSSAVGRVEEFSRPVLTPKLVSLTRDGSPRKLRRRLAGDLDNIALMALRKSPEERYGSCEQLAEDLRRHLENLPVRARPDTFIYRSAKFIRRNRAGVVAFSVAALSLVVGTALSTSQAYRLQLSEISALNFSAEALWASHRQLEALVAGVKAEERVRWTPGVPEVLQARTEQTLQKILYLVQEHNRLEGHSGWVSAVSFSPDGKLLATASREVKLWRPDGTLLRTLNAHRDWVYGVSFSPDSRRLATASRDGTIKLWNLDGTLVRTMTGHRGGVNSVRFSPDGKTLASAGRDRTVRLWDQAGRPLKVLAGHQDWAWSVRFSPDGKTLASAGRDRTVRLWDLGGNPLRTLSGHTDWVYSADFSPDGRQIVTASWDRTARLWSLDGTLLKTFIGHTGKLYEAKFRPDGKSIATASDDHTVRLWSLEGLLLKTLAGHRDSVNAVSFSSDGATLASGSNDKTVRLWNLESQFTRVFQGHGAGVEAVAFVSSQPGLPLFVSGSRDKTVRLWNLNSGFVRPVARHADEIWAVNVRPDGRQIASASNDGTIKLWKADGLPVKTLTGHDGSVNSIHFSPDGQFIVSASSDATAKLWQVDGRELRTLNREHEPIGFAEFSPDSRTVATASIGSPLIKLWNLKGGLLRTFSATGGGAITAVAFSPDGERLAAAGMDRSIQVWGRDGALQSRLQSHQDVIESLGFSPDSGLLASAGSDRTVKLWNLDGELLSSLQGHEGRINAVSFSPDGQWLVSAGDDANLIAWNVPLALEGRLYERACHHLQSYLMSNPNLSEDDRQICRNLF